MSVYFALAKINIQIKNFFFFFQSSTQLPWCLYIIGSLTTSRWKSKWERTRGADRFYHIALYGLVTYKVR